jgi:hypothetical protein
MLLKDEEGVVKFLVRQEFCKLLDFFSAIGDTTQNLPYMVVSSSSSFLAEHVTVNVKLVI